MAGKSRNRKGKPSSQSKRGTSKRHFSAAVAQQQAVPQSYEPVSRPNVSVPSASVAAPVAKVTAARYPHIATELRTIGILAGVMLIILAILAWVLS